MGDDTGRVLDLIDGAIRDHISPDAMRWVPEDERDGGEPPVPWDTDRIARLFGVPPSLVSSPGGTVRPEPNTRVWVNGQEITQHISSIHRRARGGIADPDRLQRRRAGGAGQRQGRGRTEAPLSLPSPAAYWHEWGVE